MVDPATFKQLKAFFRALQDRPLEPGDPHYVEIFEDHALSSIDPVARMARTIQFATLEPDSPESRSASEFELETVQLFSGHRGTGKSTQLRRLKQQLERSGPYKVVLCDMEDYLPMTDALDVVDFLLAAAGALSEALSVPELLGSDLVHGYWARFTSWLQSQRIEISDLGLKTGEASLGIKLNLKEDVEFRKRIRERMKLHVGAFRTEVHAFVSECLKRLKQRHGQDTQLVILYDSIEHLRGTTSNANEVTASVEALFRGHADALRFPFVHTVFTVPPWLRLQHAGVGERFDGYCQIPCVKVRERARQQGDIVDFQPGLDVLWRVACKRGDPTWLLGGRPEFDELARASGGYLRDLFRMLSILINDAGEYGVPVSAERQKLAVEELRGGYVAFTNRDAVWLRAIECKGALEVEEIEDHHRLARFLDTHILLAYRNGEDWYGVHPLIRADVLRRASEWDAAHERAGT